jgi:hypothetical protein
MVAPTGRAAATTFAEIAGAAAATFTLRAGVPTRGAGCAAAIAAADARPARARALSGCTLDAGAVIPASGAAFTPIGALGVRCDAGTTAAGRGGAGERGGVLSGCAVAGAGAVGVDAVPDCAAAACAEATKIADAIILMDFMVSPSWYSCYEV